jgi:uncharacterized damage-inducible protein DinB
MSEPGDRKNVLLRHLRDSRRDLIWKLDGVSERDARLPRTPTGTSLLGIVKHCLNVEAGYFGPTFGRAFPSPDELVPMAAYDDDPQADWWATETESRDGLVDLYQRVGAFVDETIASLPLDAPGAVPWWAPGRQDVTLHFVLVHVLDDIARHVGQADILRELLDGASGWRPGTSNLPAAYDWAAYVCRLTALAERF